MCPFFPRRLKELGQQEGFLQKINFTKTSLGRITPNIGGIKVYQHISRNEIIMDVDLTWASDCDLSFGLFRWLSAALRDLYVHGTLRVTLKPLLKDLPLVGSIQVAFVHNPRIDFDLGGIANVIDIPGLSRLARNLIIEQIGNFAVLPNAIVVPMVEPSDKDREVSLLIGKISCFGSAASYLFRPFSPQSGSLDDCFSL